MTVDLPQVEEAARTIAGAVHRTPVFSSTRIGRPLGIDLRLKAELFQRTGCFKPRGALNRLLHTPDEALARGLVTVSAGNHAQGLAWAAAQVGAACTVVMPADASPTKAEATRGYGAEVILEGTTAEAFDLAERLRHERGLLLVHPFDDPLVIAGQGTVGLEIVDQVTDVDVVVCPIGGGGLISGIAVAVKGLRPETRIYGVEPEGSAVMRLSWDRQEVARLDRIDTVADGLTAPMAGQNTFPLTREHVDDILVISDHQIVEGMKALLSYAKLYAEPAGAAAVGALMAGVVPADPGETVVAVVSGGNVDLDRAVELLGTRPTA